MSTKTLRKRIALVAVAALGFAGLTSVSANAAETSATGFTIMSSSASSVSSLTKSTTVLTYDAAALTLTAGANTWVAGDVGKGVWSNEYGFIGTIASVTSATVAVLTAAPTATSSGSTTPMGDTDTTNDWFYGTKAATTVADGITTGSISGMTVTAGKIAALNLKFNAATDDDVSKTRVTIGGSVLNTSALTTIGDGNKITTFTAPIIAGTYVATVQYAIDADFSALTTVSKTFTLTVLADSAFSAGASTVLINDDPTGADGDTTAAVDALGATGIKTSGIAAAKIWVNLKKADGTTYSGGTLYTYVTGPGFADIDNTTSLRADSAANDGNHFISVAGDGTSGVGTVNIYVILEDGVTKVDLPSKKVSFYGDVAKLEATVEQGIAKVGAENGNCVALTDCTYATLAETPAILVKATDANGVLVSGLTLSAVSADTSIVGAASVSGATGVTDKHGAGYYNASVTGGTIANIGKSTTVTFSVTLSDGTVIKSNAATVSLGGSPNKVSLSTDKATYAPGEKIVVTVTAKDSSGNNAADGTYANLFAGASKASGSIGGSLPAAQVELVGGKAEYTAYAPATSGTYAITNTTDSSTGSASGTGVSASITVTSAIDTQIASLITKINALQKLIAKIQKKLGVK